MAATDTATAAAPPDSYSADERIAWMYGYLAGSNEALADELRRQQELLDRMRAETEKEIEQCQS